MVLSLKLFRDTSVIYPSFKSRFMIINFQIYYELFSLFFIIPDLYRVTQVFVPRVRIYAA